MTDRRTTQFAGLNGLLHNLKPAALQASYVSILIFAMVPERQLAERVSTEAFRWHLSDPARSEGLKICGPASAFERCPLTDDGSRSDTADHLSVNPHLEVAVQDDRDRRCLFSLTEQQFSGGHMVYDGTFIALHDLLG